MTIFFIIDSMSGGGAERFVLEIISNLIHSDHKIILGLLNLEGELFGEIPKSVDIIDLSKYKKWYSLVPASLQMRKTQKKFSFDIIFSTLTSSNCFALRSTLLLRKNFKIIINIRSNIHAELGELPAIRGWLRKLEIKTIYPRADNIIAVSKGVKSGLVRHFKVNRNKIEVIYNIFDLQKIRLLSKEEIVFPWEDMHNELKVIIASGRLVAQKDYPDLIRTFKTINAYDCNFRLLILGDGILKNELNGLIVKLALENYVVIMGFIKNPFPYYRQAKYYISTSLWEGFSRSLAEAKICGSVPVVTDCDYGPSELISNGENGILISPGNISSMAEAIIALEKDPEQYAALKRNKDMGKLDKSIIMENFEKLISRN